MNPCPRCGDPQSNRIDGVETRRYPMLSPRCLDTEPSELAMPQAINADGEAFDLGSWMHLRAALARVQQLEQELGLAQTPHVRVAMDVVEVEVSEAEREHQASE